jgi:hypothetical protein
MNLEDFERRGDSGRPRFVTTVRDVGGDEVFELTLTAPEALIREVLAEATIELTIDSARTQETLVRETDHLRAEHREAMWRVAGLEETEDLLKPQPPWPRPEDSVLAALRPVHGEGTPFSLSISNFGVARGRRIFFTGSWVFNTFASVRPSSGDQDLFLHLFAATGPVLSASILPGVLLDVVSFAVPPPFPFLPVFEVLGFITGTCANFTAFGV